MTRLHLEVTAVSLEIACLNALILGIKLARAIMTRIDTNRAKSDKDGANPLALRRIR